MIGVQHHRGSYDVQFAEPSQLDQLLPPKRVVLVDANVATLWAGLVSAEAIVIPEGEDSKSLVEFGRLCEILAERRVTRETTLVALGGGVVGDLVGYVAASYMRGVPFVQIPTTLLSMVDSSVGGKVGVDLKGGKNLVGAFYPPAAVFICPDFLATLPERQVINGTAEVWKYGFILDPTMLPQLRSNEALSAEIIRRCIQLKADVVQKDEFDRLGLRATLNFGHSVGHALETLTGYGPLLHGEAIAIGMVAEARIGEALEITPKGTAELIEADLRHGGLPTWHHDLKNPDLIATMRGDKKVEGHGLAFSLLTELGACKLCTGIAESLVAEVLSQP